MNKLTSIADFYFKVKTDKRYETLLIYARKTSYSSNGSIGPYEEALAWMEDWINRTRDEYAQGHGCSCCVMVSYLNSTLVTMREAKLI